MLHDSVTVSNGQASPLRCVMKIYGREKVPAQAISGGHWDVVLSVKHNSLRIYVQ